MANEDKQNGIMSYSFGKPMAVEEEKAFSWYKDKVGMQQDTPPYRKNPEPLYKPSAWESMPDIKQVIEMYSSKLLNTNMDIAALRPNVSSTSPSSGVAPTLYAPEGEGLSGRLDGQLGYSKATARQGDGPANAVAAALGRNVAAPVAADDSSPDASPLVINNKNAVTSGMGLMSNAKRDAAKDVAAGRSNDVMINNLVDTLGVLESDQDHVEGGRATYAYGVMEATAKAHNVKRSDYGQDADGRRAFARSVYKKIYEKNKKDDPAFWNALPENMHKGVMAYVANLGSMNSTTKTAVQSGNPSNIRNALDGYVHADYDQAIYDSTTGDYKKDSDGNLLYATKKNSKGVEINAEGNPLKPNEKPIILREKYADKGVSKRRAIEYNILVSEIANAPKVATVEVDGTVAKPIFVWKAADGSELQRFPSPNKLAPSSTTTTMTLE